MGTKPTALLPLDPMPCKERMTTAGYRPMNTVIGFFKWAGNVYQIPAEGGWRYVDQLTWAKPGRLAAGPVG